MAIFPQALKLLNSIERIQPRMMCATFNDKHRITIVFYSDEIPTFYNGLSSFVWHFFKYSDLTISGNTNAYTG